MVHSQLQKNHSLRNYMLFPLLIWLAFLLGPRGVARVLLLVAVIATWNTLRGYGIFSFTNQDQAEHLVSLQIFLAVETFSGFDIEHHHLRTT